MEGAILEPEIFGSLGMFFGGVIVLGIVCAIVLFGYMAEEEKSGKRLYWAEWPLPEAETPTPKEDVRKAA